MLHLSVNQGDGLPLYLQLVQQIKHLVATGRLKPDSELPPVRTLAQQLVLNPNTVVRAYRELEVAGLIYKKRGAGTYVANGATPFTDDECRKILKQRTEALLVEGRHLGYGLEQLIELMRACDGALKAGNGGGQGAQVS
ncbi:MAG: GntR family transcriptional regulator [Candidatus Hydrogenedentales bacterium]|jgi:GntR family transcriptional regulator